MRVSWAAYSASEMARKKAPMAIEMRLKKDGSGWFGVFINARVECAGAPRMAAFRRDIGWRRAGRAEAWPPEARMIPVRAGAPKPAAALG
jgi:hypothetical protein